MKTADFSLGVISDLFVAGQNEDGEEVIGHVYFVLAEDKTGRRFAHVDYVKDTVRKACEDSDTGFYWCVVLDAEDQANKTKDTLLGLEEMDMTQWREDEPAYGSIAYQKKYNS